MIHRNLSHRPPLAYRLAYIVTYTLKITRLEPNLPPLEGIELQRFKRHFWKWHGSGNKMGGWPLLGFDFEVLKNRSNGTPCKCQRFSMEIVRHLEKFGVSCIMFDLAKF